MVTKMTKNKPEIRFDGFTIDWEQCMLGDVLEVNSGRDYKHLKEGNIPVYGTGGYMLSVNDSLSDTDAIGIGRKGTIDKPQLLKAPFWTVDTLFYMTTKKENDLLFYYSLANKIRWKKYDESTGVPSLSKSSIDKIPISSPVHEEQEKIGNFFKQLDDTIALHQSEYKQLINLKKAMLQKMFPRNGKRVPEIRFKGFTGDWEQRKLGDCVDYIKGFAFKSEDYRSDGIRIVRVSDLSSNEIKSDNEKIFIDREYEKEYQKYKLNVGDIIITTVGSKAELRESAVGRAIIVKKDIDGLLNQNLVKISPINGYDSYFIYGNLLNVKYIDYIASIERGNANQANIALNDLWQYTIYLASNTEQQKIGSFFKQLDDTIALYHERLNKFNQIKKSMFIKMFI